ncbi:MAG: hypothetical protein MSN52_05765 [Limosilactobacillus reuteri]|nr:hypothetical protein [Limosilactobacillus reuteri]MDY2689476.1 hypothetical protein [Limosilactobacillus reuteri]
MDKNKLHQNWLSAEDKLKRLTGIKYVTSEMPIPDASINGSKEEKTIVCLYDAGLDFEEALTLAKKIYLSLNKYFGNVQIWAVFFYKKRDN